MNFNLPSEYKGTDTEIVLNGVANKGYMVGRKDGYVIGCIITGATIVLVNAIIIGIKEVKELKERYINDTHKKRKEKPLNKGSSFYLGIM